MPEFAPLTEPQKGFLREGIDLFNQEKFFECHEALEQAWLAGAGEQKTFLQGLIQAAVALHHLRQGNLVGARRLLEAGVEKLAPYAPRREPVDVAALLAALEPLRRDLREEKVPLGWQPPRIKAAIAPPSASG